MATSNDIKNGTVLNLDGQLWNVIEFQHVKPGKGGAFVRTKLRNVKSGNVFDRTFNAGVRVEPLGDPGVVGDRRQVEGEARAGMPRGPG